MRRSVSSDTVEPPELAAGVPESVANGIALRVAIGGDGAWTGGVYGGIAGIDCSPIRVTIRSTCFRRTPPMESTSAMSRPTKQAMVSASCIRARMIKMASRPTNTIRAMEPGRPSWASPMFQSRPGTTARAARGQRSSRTTWRSLPAASTGLDIADDDHGNTSANATSLHSASDTWSGSGIIETNTDVDVFSFEVRAADTYRIGLDVAEIGANLHAIVELRNAPPGRSWLRPIRPRVWARQSRLSWRPTRTTFRSPRRAEYGRVGAYTVSVSAPPAGITVPRPVPLVLLAKAERQRHLPLRLTRSRPTDVTIPVSSATLPAEGDGFDRDSCVYAWPTGTYRRRFRSPALTMRHRTATFPIRS